MIYIEHDFYSNLLGSTNSGDKKATVDIFLNEISDLVATKPSEIESLLTKVGIAVKPNPKKGELISLVIENINSNGRLLKGISFIIAEKNGLLDTKDVSNADGNGGKRVLTEIVDDIANQMKPALSNLDGEVQKKEAKENLRQTVTAKTGEIIESDNDSNVALYIGLIAAAAIGVGLYFYFKNKPQTQI
jgi:hypothetical protein